MRLTFGPAGESVLHACLPCAGRAACSSPDTQSGKLTVSHRVRITDATAVTELQFNARPAAETVEASGPARPANAPPGYTMNAFNERNRASSASTDSAIAGCSQRRTRRMPLRIRNPFRYHSAAIPPHRLNSHRVRANCSFVLFAYLGKLRLGETHSKLSSHAGTLVCCHF